MRSFTQQVKLSSLLTYFFIGTAYMAVAQDLNTQKTGYLQISSDTTRLDSSSILASSFHFYLNDTIPVDTALYEIDAINALLIWKAELPKDSMKYSYRTLNLDFSKVYQNRSATMIQPESNYYNSPITYSQSYNSQNTFESTKLNKTGSISRGLGFGNNQDLTVNSTLSLQLNGKLTEKISVLASITDDNIPIQPEGNTALLQEFDQVYIQLYDENSKLTAGDFIIKTPIGYFTNYFKRAQGASFTTRQAIGKDKTKTFFTETSAAVSKGKFSRNIIQGSEGNQGPYRLNGNENETFIIILAGTERVFIDGRELKRGQENDYVIDYNTAEITFTAKQLINKDKRIAVEFQYSDANYVRSLLQTSTGIETEKYKLYLNFFSEQDAKNQPLQQDLSDEDKRLLDAVGDQVELALAPSYTELDEYNNNRVIYTLVDTLGYDSVFVRITEEAERMYTVNFSEVGQGVGNYIQEGFEATGRVFIWVAPDTINGQIFKNGNYAPVRRLVAPKKNQMLMAGGIFEFSERTHAMIETGFSNYDVNTFSETGNGDNLSHALKASASHIQPLSKNPDPFELKAYASFESIGDNFSPIEPYRSVEFNRNWNIADSLNVENQDIISGGLSVLKQTKIKLDYFIDRFTVGEAYNGLKNSVLADVHIDGFDTWFIGSRLETKGAEKSTFSRHKLRVEKDLWITKIGFQDEQETNRRYNAEDDSLSPQSYKFYDWKFYFKDRDSSRVGYEIFYRERKDFGSNQNTYNESTHATHYGLDLYFTQNPKNQFKASISNRELKITDSELTAQAPENTLLGRLEHAFRIVKNSIVSNIYYEIGSGLERRQEFVYIQDPTGQGPYTWIDYNNDGHKDLNEFELARLEDGDRYIRIFTPTDAYERAYSNQFSQSLNLNPAGVWGSKEGFLKVLSKFSNQTAFRIQRKTRLEEGSDRFNPFAASLGDSTLISQSSSVRNTFFYNRSSSQFGVDYTFSNQFAKNPLTTGFEERENLLHLLRIRLNFNSKSGLILEQEIGKRQSLSDIITGRNYLIDYFNLKQTYSYQPSTAFRLSLSNSYTNKKNKPSFGGETAEIVDLGLDCRFSKVESGTMFAQINLISIKYSGDANNSLSYEMLDGLQDGQNITWGAGIQRNLGKNLQLSLSYNGRKSEEVKAIHTGSTQIRAYF